MGATRQVYMDVTVRMRVTVDEGVEDMQAVAAWCVNPDPESKPEDHDLPPESVTLDDIEVVDVQVTDSK